MRISKEAKIGIFVTLVLAVFIWGYNFLKGINLFEGGSEYHVIYPKVEGLGESAPILINGYKVGHIQEIELKPALSNALLVNFFVSGDFKIPQGTKAKITSSDIMGNKAITLVFPENINAYHAVGDTLSAAYGEGLAEIAASLQGKAESTITGLDSMITKLNEMLDDSLKNNFQEIANSSAITMKNLEQSTSENGDLHETLENMNQISSSLADNDQQIEKILHNINSLTANLSEINYSQSVRKLDSTTTKLNQLLAGMNSGRGTAGKLMTDDSLYINLNNLTYSLDLLINDMKDNPKKYVHFSIFGKDNE